MTIKLRYKPLAKDQSSLLSTVVKDADVRLEDTSNDFRFATSVAAYGMLLRKSDFCETFCYDNILSLAKGAKGTDSNGYRAEFIQLVETTQLMP